MPVIASARFIKVDQKMNGGFRVFDGEMLGRSIVKSFVDDSVRTL